MGLEGSRELLALECLCRPSLGLHCPCGPPVTAAVRPGRLCALDLMLNLPPGLGRPPIAEEDMGGSRLAETILRGLTPWHCAWGSRKG